MSLQERICGARQYGKPHNRQLLICLSQPVCAKVVAWLETFIDLVGELIKLLNGDQVMTRPPPHDRHPLFQLDIAGSGEIEEAVSFLDTAAFPRAHWTGVIPVLLNEARTRSDPESRTRWSRPVRIASRPRVIWSKGKNFSADSTEFPRWRWRTRILPVERFQMVCQPEIGGN